MARRDWHGRRAGREPENARSDARRTAGHRRTQTAGVVMASARSADLVAAQIAARLAHLRLLAAWTAYARPVDDDHALHRFAAWWNGDRALVSEPHESSKN